MRSVRWALPLGCVALAFAPSCSGAGSDCEADSCNPPPPSFGAPDGRPNTNDAAPPELCASNECPPERTSCPGVPFPCAVDVRSDEEHCGECGHRCLTLPGADPSCVDGECRLLCDYRHADCNGLAEDGCETSIFSDAENCGACKAACAPKQDCNRGSCVCATASLGPDYNCGGCGVACPPSDKPPLPAAWRARYGCADGACEQPVCDSEWGDCNGDLRDPSGDGCEANLGSDPGNCGGCGFRCAPGEICFAGRCVCPCGSACFRYLESDLDNCGACGHRCPGDRNPARGHGAATCVDAHCDYRCAENWGNCDGDLDNGCEANLLIDPRNCGGCGVRCDGIERQACVDGRCAMKECPVR